MGTSPNTVRTQISRIYKKLEVHDKSALAKLLAAA
jgi:DNA-binding CsgD family transcriptional regulator